MSVTVIGSFIVDCIARCNKAPEAGETVVGNSFNTYLGGKGANQAVACKRMGAETKMIGCVGNDNFGNEFINYFKKEGFDTSLIKISNIFTGTSLVTVEESGQNRIVMTPGANLDYSKEELSNLKSDILSSNYVVSQFEMREEIITEISNIIKGTNTKFILNPAPAHMISDEVLKSIYIITPNETELSFLVNERLETMDDYIKAAKSLISKGVKNVIVTLGSKGSLLVNSDGETFVESYKVKVVDTVGAGDSFTGSMSAMLDQGYSIIESMKIATVVAALEIQRNGAIPAMPYKEEVFAFMNK